MQKQDFGARLRSIRKAKRVTGSELAVLLGMSQSKISKIESGLIRPSKEFAQSCAAALKLNARERNQFIAFCDLFIAEFPTWTTEDDNLDQAREEAFSKIEHSARTIRIFQTSFVPWLLQTKSYTEFALRASMVSQSDQEPDVSKRVKELLSRQRILISNRNFVFLLTEGALKCRLAPVATMIEQYRHIDELMKRDNVRICLIPSSADIRLISNTGFELYDDKLLRIETMTDVLNELDEAKIAQYRAVFEELLSVSVEGDALKGNLHQLTLNLQFLELASSKFPTHAEEIAEMMNRPLTQQLPEMDVDESHRQKR